MPIVSSDNAARAQQSEAAAQQMKAQADQLRAIVEDLVGLVGGGQGGREAAPAALAHAQILQGDSSLAEDGGQMLPVLGTAKPEHDIKLRPILQLSTPANPGRHAQN